MRNSERLGFESLRQMGHFQTMTSGGGQVFLLHFLKVRCGFRVFLRGNHLFGFYCLRFFVGLFLVGVCGEGVPRKILNFNLKSN